MTSDTHQAQNGIPSENRLYVRLLPLTLTGIWASTALSVEVHRPELEEMFWRLGVGDFVLNVVLYVPLGIVLRRYGCLRSALAGAVLSVLIESVQLFYPGRFTALFDVVANTLGAFAGCLIFARAGGNPRRYLESIELSRRIGGFSIAVGVIFVLLVSFPRQPSDFRNWDPESRLLLGDEMTGDRRFTGTVFKAVILKECLNARSISQLYKQHNGTHPTSKRVTSDAVYTYDDSSRFDAVRGKPLLQENDQRGFYDTLVRNGTLTILAWFRTDDLLQSGPTRIVSYSTSLWKQNFLLGQEGRNLVFRVLTPTTAPGGFTPQLETQRVLVNGRRAFVAATYDGRNSRVYLDGRQIQRLNLRAHGRVSPFLADNGLPTAAVVSGMLASLGIFAISTRFLRRRWLVGALVGFNAGVVMLLLGAADALTEFAIWIPVLGLWGGVMVACSVHRSHPD